MARYSQNAPYPQSRAALRQIYGTRAITSKGQSERDFTPSGRRAYLEGQGNNPDEVVAKRDAEWKAMFPRYSAAAQADSARTVSGVAPQFQGTPSRPMFAGGVASPEDVGTLVRQGAMGTVNTPYGTVTLPESTVAPEDMAEFLPATASPLSGFGLPQRTQYMSSVLKAANRWRTPV